MTLRSFIAVVALLGLMLRSPGLAGAQSAVVDRPAELRSGTCAAPGELVAALANLVVTIGDPQGQTTAMPVEQSGTIVPFSVSTLLESDHIVAVYKSTAEPSVMVACGEIGGTRNPDGTLASGMVGYNGSGLSGIVYFTPNPGFDNILITILLVGGEAPASEAEGTDAEAAAEPVTASDTVVVAEPVTVSESTVTGTIDQS